MKLIIFLIIIIILLVGLFHDLSYKSGKIFFVRCHSIIIGMFKFLVVGFENKLLFISLINNNRKVIFKHQKYSLFKTNVGLYNDFIIEDNMGDIQTLCKYYKKVIVRYRINNMLFADIAEIDKSDLSIKYYDTFKFYNIMGKPIDVKSIDNLIINNISIDIFNKYKVSELVYLKKQWYVPNNKIKSVIFADFTDVSNIDLRMFEEVSFNNAKCDKLEINGKKKVKLYKCEIREVLCDYIVQMYDCNIYTYLFSKNYLSYKSKSTNISIFQKVLLNKKHVRICGYNYFNKYRKYDYIGIDGEKKMYYFDSLEIDKKIYNKIANPINDFSIFLERKYKWHNYKNYKSFKPHLVKMVIKNEISDLKQLIDPEFSVDVKMLMIKLYFERIRFKSPLDGFLNILIRDCNYFTCNDKIINMSTILDYNQIISRIDDIIEENDDLL